METLVIFYIVFFIITFLLGFIIPFQVLNYVSNSKPNKALGYRSKMSFLSKETWVYANKRAAELFLKMGLLYLGFMNIILVFILFTNFENITGELYILIPLIIPIFFLIYIIYKVESELKKFFDLNGNKK